MLWQVVRVGVGSGPASAIPPSYSCQPALCTTCGRGLLAFRDSGSFIIRGRLWTLPDDALAAARMRLSGSSTARPALSFWRRLEPVGWPLALMCFGPKHRSGCALHVSTSGANKRRNRDLSRKPNHTLGTSQESRLFALRQSGAGISRVEGGSFVLARCEQKFAAL